MLHQCTSFPLCSVCTPPPVCFELSVIKLFQDVYRFWLQYLSLGGRRTWLFSTEIPVKIDKTYHGCYYHPLKYTSLPDVYILPESSHFISHNLSIESRHTSRIELSHGPAMMHRLQRRWTTPFTKPSWPCPALGFSPHHKAASGQRMHAVAAGRISRMRNRTFQAFKITDVLSA